MVESARNLVKNQLASSSLFTHGVFSLLELPFRLIGKPFPIYKPNKLWYEQPLHYMASHLNLYGDGDVVPMPSYATFFDYELEIGVVIAKHGRNLTEKEAENIVGGFVVWNDFSVRNVQLGEVFGKLGFGKAKNSSNQMGNIIVTADEFLPKISHGIVEAKCRINSKVVGSGNTKNMAHSVGEAVAFISQSENLHPGEVIGLGTIPGCCGIERNEKLQPDDLLDISIDGIGSLKCTIGQREAVPSDQWKSEAKKQSSQRTSRPIRFAFLSLVVLLLSILLYRMITDPSPIDPQFFDPKPTPHKIPFDFDFPVQFVQDVQLFANDSFAPESFAYDTANDVIYTSMRDGTIRTVDFNSGTNQVIARTGSVQYADLPPLSECDKPQMQHICGVPLGLFLHGHLLYVADSYFGVLVLDLNNNNKLTRVVDRYEGVPFKFTNNVVVSSDDVLYFTDSSTKFYLSDYQLETLEGNGLGRLFRYNLRQETLDLLLDNLHFANGLILSPDESKLLISETTRFRIREYELHKSVAENSNEKHYLTENMPCFPDNIRQFGDEITVGCASPRTKFTQLLSGHPGVRKIFAKIPFFSALFSLVRPKAALILVIDANSGHMKRAIYDPMSRFHSVSEANIYKGYMYVGSFHNPFIARFKVPEA